MTPTFHTMSTTDDIFESPAQALVNAVNCVGVMGAGLAKAFKQRYPDYFRVYKTQCDRLMPGIVLGHVMDHAYAVEGWPARGVIFSFPTKDHWRHDSTYENIKEGLGFLNLMLDEWDIDSVAIPALGCGLGGLDWKVVEPMIREGITNTDDVYLYPPR